MAQLDRLDFSSLLQSSSQIPAFVPAVHARTAVICLDLSRPAPLHISSLADLFCNRFEPVFPTNT